MARVPDLIEEVLDEPHDKPVMDRLREERLVRFAVNSGRRIIELRVILQ